MWAIEGTGGYGAGLTRFLHAHAEQVLELDRPKQATRRHGPKSDPLDATRAARVRLHRSGDRQLNQALYTVVLTRLRTDPATRAYAQRRRAQGKTNREIKRCLIRYVARQLYRLLETQPALDTTEERPTE